MARKKRTAYVLFCSSSVNSDPAHTGALHGLHQIDCFPEIVIDSDLDGRWQPAHLLSRRYHLLDELRFLDQAGAHAFRHGPLLGATAVQINSVGHVGDFLCRKSVAPRALHTRQVRERSVPKPNQQTSRGTQSERVSWLQTGRPVADPVR